MANIITGCRILFSIFLLFFPAFSFRFYFCYISAGLTDMLDGFVARRTGTESEFGSKLDTVADLVFFAVCAIKILAEIRLSVWLWVWILIIAAIKTSNFAVGFAIHKSFVAEHTVLNKATGLLMFLLPLTISFVDIEFGAAVVCAAATAAAVQEGYRIIKRKR